MKRLLLLLVTLVGFAYAAFAQLEVKQGSFKEVPGFVNINSDPDYQYDDNDMPFAVIKVRTENIDDKQRRDLRFESNLAVGIMLEYKTGEVWVYLTAKYADYLKISHPDFSSIEYTLPFDLQPKKGYEMTLVNKTVAVSSGWASLTIQTKPENGAKILLNGRYQYATTPYTNNMLPAGKYEITVSKDRFETTTQTVDIQDGDNKIVEIEMPYLYGELYVASESYGTNLLADGAINSVFSVSSSKKVIFSQGNLQYQASTGIWRFAEHQWDNIGRANKNISSSYSGWIDLFGWGTGNDPTNSSINNTDYDSFSDWGYNSISNGGGKNWFTLTIDEWVYVLKTRSTSSGIRYAKATVNGVHGVILLPDNWSSSNYNLSKTNQWNAAFTSNRISKSKWISKLEANGAVFLPVTGVRDGTRVHYVWFSYGYYWSATYRDSDCAYVMWFCASDINTDQWGYRKYGWSVRLVCNAE